MRLLFNETIYGWRMSGLMGREAAWFLGFIRIPDPIKDYREDLLRKCKQERDRLSQKPKNGDS
jgi:hypothetical protein